MGAAQNAYYARHRERILRERKTKLVQRRDWARQHRAQMRELLNAIKSRPCADCGGVFDPVCMDFDHLPGNAKRGNVSKMAKFSERQALAEVAKCDVVCANCHRLRTKKRTQERR